MIKPNPASAPHLPVAARSIAAAVAACFAAAVATSASALEFDTGNPDLTIRWDNTVRYNYAVRVENRDNKIGNTVIADEGTWRFDRGDCRRQPLRRPHRSSTSSIMKRFGARLSAAGWYDFAYNDDSKTNPNLPFTQIPSYINKKYSTYTNRFYQGPSGEILDAFVFAGFDLWSAPTSVKVGSHTIYWGESLFVNGNLHSVAYSQNPLDLQKGFATPGSEAKELFRPLNQISATSQITDTLSISASYLLEWEAYRYPEGGTYLGPVDFVFNGPDRQFLSGALGFAANGNPSEPKEYGEWGLAVRWSPEWLDGTLGFYYRNYADKLPQTLLTTVGPNRSVYNLIYADDVDLFGVSLAKNIGGVSVGAELSYRRNTPLNSQVLGIAPGLPSEGETKGPRGDTLHGLVNSLGVIPQTPVFDAATWAAELTFAHYTKVRSGANLFMAEGYAPCAGRDKWDGCTTRNYAGLALAFTPIWYQVFPGVDLFAPVTYAIGLSGNAPTVFGGNQALRQLQHRCRCRRVPEIPFRPEVHRLGRSLQGQRHVGHERRTASRRC